MKKTKKIMVHLILGALSIAGIIGITVEAASLYTLVSTHQEETESVTTKGKRISSDLYGNLEFYAVLEADKTWSEVTRDEFEQLDDGDTIEITKEDSSDNKAYRSGIYKSILFITLYAIGPSHYISFLIARTRRVKGWGWLGWPIGVTMQLLLYGFLAAILIYGYSSIGKMVFNAVQSYTGIQHETEAIVTASDANINTGRHETNYYHLSMQYEDAEGNTIHMTKEVRPSVYNNSTTTAEISFREMILIASIQRDFPYQTYSFILPS